jgi:hypothetical protein
MEQLLMKHMEIPLTQGKVALVDARDYERISRIKWYANKIHNTWYALKNGKRLPGGKKEKPILMHRLILNAPKGIQVDHKNGNGLDNRRRNLRLCTNQENHMNEQKHKRASSRYKSVCFCKQTERWSANIMRDGKRVWLGRHDTEEEAALTYDKAAKEIFGQFANLNFPER